jgi:dihydrofolate synthase / folylpolyglutamate synthase
VIPTRTFRDVCDELDARRHITLGFERINALLAALDHPERALRVVQVVGTNGKGTTAVALAAALEWAGPSTGTYLSPHLLAYTERVRVGNRFVSEGEFAEGMDEAISVADARGIPASQFELLTAGAVKLFAGRGLDWAVLEAGLGARHDATTAAKPEAVVLTNVGMDHTEYLGETVEEISAEKLGGLADNGLLILGTDDPRVVAVARETSARRGARLVGGVAVDERLPSGLPPYLRHNVSLGIRAAEELVGTSLDRKALERVVEGVVGALPGRFEEFEVGGVPVVVDGGHNPSGIEASLAAVGARYPGRSLGVVFGALRDKDIRSMLSALRREADGLVLTRPDEGRALDPAQVMLEFEPRDRAGRPARVVPETARAVVAAAEEMRERNGVVLVTGSLYTGAAALRTLRGQRGA